MVKKLLGKLFDLVVAVGPILLLACLASWLFVQRNAADYPLLKDAATPENVQIMLDLAESTGALQLMGEHMTQSDMVSLLMLNIYARVKKLSLIGAIWTVVGVIATGLIDFIKER